MKKRETPPKQRRNASAESPGVVELAPTGIEPELAQSVQEQDYHALVKEFLRTRKSKQTSRRYRNAIRLWTSWCADKGIQPLSAKPEHANRWAEQLGGAPATRDSSMSSVSSLYTWLSHRKNRIPRSPFFQMPRGVGTPLKSRTLTARDIRKTLGEVGKDHRPAIIAMAYRGFRVGALQGLTVSGSKFETKSKGKAWIGVLPPEVIKALRPLGKHPFKTTKQGTIASAFKRATKRLAKRGDIEQEYSVNDLRRFFAVREYAKDHNVERVALLLNLSSTKEMPRLLGWPNRFSGRRKGHPGEALESITSLQDFIRRIAHIRGESADNHELFFRGHDDMNYKLVPSLFYRGGGYVETEHAMFREMILQNPADFSADMTALEKLVRMQHFSLPTRLLDFTGNPLVALFFACREQSQKTGEIVHITVPKEEIKYYDSDTVSVIANLAKVPYSEKLFDTSLCPEEFNKEDNAQRLVHLIREEKPYFRYSVEPKDIHRVVCVKVKMNNKRIVAQDGVFLAFGIGRSRDECATIEQEWTPSIEDRKKRILVDWESKQTILEELDLIGISERTLFPDMETAARSITLRYQ